MREILKQVFTEDLKIDTQPKYQGSSIENESRIFKNGVYIGYIMKFKDTKTEKNPWKAFRLKAGVPRRPPYDPEHYDFEVFYGKDGKKKAIDFVSKGG